MAERLPPSPQPWICIRSGSGCRSAWHQGAETAFKQADVDSLTTFSSKAYNYHGLNRSDVRQGSDQHPHRAASSHRAVRTNMPVGLDLWSKVPCGANISTDEPLAWRNI